MALDPQVAEKLAAPLDPARVKHREGGGGRSLSYLEGHDVIRTANDVFGVAGWGYHVKELVCLGEEPVVTTRNGQTREGFRVAYRATVDVSGPEGAGFSDVGYGDAMEYTGSKLTPHELASKEAVTDGLKRALKNFGDQFGLCLYDRFAPEHDGRTASPAADGSRGGAAGARAGTATPSASPPAPAPNGQWTMPFGKHKGQTIEQIHGDNPGYLDWLMDKSDKQDIKDRIVAFRESLVAGELVAAGATEVRDGFTDPSDIPFERSIDGFGN